MTEMDIVGLKARTKHEALMAVLDAAIDLLVANGPCEDAEYDDEGQCESECCEYCRLAQAVQRAGKEQADD